ncbi:hypothetical protein CONLIGDRAFT_687901 [Coniochaeta ligniaria NRRL 30616]|uniref:Uncharacterized protein n=1 Tax=Coniochaeta ligniaria NRRL 30616 TaxID=1408157 RepID=A0A1J7IWX4_9PEZI|nr:hypothetical protein CONLIGDRAFT_687901 [Coniochaeta ligniaria NRRL 30616]
MALQAEANNQTARTGRKWPIPYPEKLGVNISTIRYLDGSVTSLHAKMDSLMEMMRSQMAVTEMRIKMAQNQQLATEVEDSLPTTAASPSPCRGLPDDDDDFERIGHHQLPRRDREMTPHCEIKPENGRRSYAPFAPVGNSFNRQQSAYVVAALITLL